MTIRPLVTADVDAVAEADFAAWQDAALRHGTTPVAAAVRDSREAVRRLLEGDPLGGVVAEEGGGIVGHAWVHPRGPIATVGPIAVEPPAQRRGAGRALLAHCLQAAGPRASQVRLVTDAAHLGAFELFLQSGFRVVAPVLELVRAGIAPGTTPPSVPQVTIRTAEGSDQTRIVARDARPFGTSRPHDVERVLRSGRGVVAERGKTLAGYALAGAGMLGPASADDPELVVALLVTLASDAALGATPLRAMVLATDRVLVDGLRAGGFRVARAHHYMVRGGGTAPPAGYVLMGAAYM